MMVYAVKSRNSRWTEAAAHFGVSVFCSSGVLSLFFKDDSRDGAIFMFVISSFLTLGFLAATISILREPCSLQIGIDGTVIVQRAIGSTRLRADQIRSLEGRYDNDYHDYVWRLVLRSTRHEIAVDEFPTVMHFVHRIEALNPLVKIRGTWPMVSP